MPFCDPCDRYFASSDDYRKHMQNSSRHNYCNNCRKDFASWQGLKEHWVRALGESIGCRVLVTPIVNTAVVILMTMMNSLTTTETIITIAKGATRCSRTRGDSTNTIDSTMIMYYESCRRVFQSASNLSAASLLFFFQDPIKFLFGST